MHCTDKKRILLGLLFLAMGLFFLKQINSFEPSFSLEPGTLHPMSMPRFLMYIWCALSVMYIVVPREAQNLDLLWTVMPRICSLIGIIAIFIVALQYVGFFVSGFFLLVSVFYTLGFRNKYSPIIAFVCIGCVWFLFNYAMSMPLPDFTLF